MKTKLPGVAIATPCLTHYVAMEYLSSALQTDWHLAGKGYNRAYLNHCGDQFVAKARCKLVHDFMVNHEGFDNFFFIDDDIGWPAEKVWEFCERDEDILVGAYPKKSPEPDWPIMLAGEGGKLVEKDGLVRVLRGPTGFMRIKRRVLEGMLEHAKPFLDTDIEGNTCSTPGLFWAGPAPDGWFWTEDYIFCQNATALGYEIWCDPDIEFIHRGNKAWGGAIKNDLHVFREKAEQAFRVRQEAEANAVTTVTEGELIKPAFGKSRKRSSAA